MSAPNPVSMQSPPMSILLAEDSPVVQTMLRGMLLKWGYTVVQAATGTEALRILDSEDSPRMAIVDWMMPGMHGPELCRRVRAKAREPYTYILLLTSRDDSSDIVEGLESGADDYLTKPFNAQELRARLRAGARIVTLQQQLLETREKLRRQASIDDLTGLPNRATILDTLQRELGRADRAGEHFAILLADIDRIRQINDCFGHLAGDAVLQEFGRRLSASAPPRAVVGRYSGEEFLMLLPGLPRAEAEALGRHIQDAIAADPVHAGAASFPVTCTVGAAAGPMPHSADAHSLLHAAEEALLAARSEARERLAGALRASARSIAAHPGLA